MHVLSPGKKELQEIYRVGHNGISPEAPEVVVRQHEVHVFRHAGVTILQLPGVVGLV